MPPSQSSGGDLVDQVRDWFERVHRGAGEWLAGRRVGRGGGQRPQAVPLGSHQARGAVSAAGRSGGRRATTRSRADRAERTTYTLVFAAVLVALAIGLFFLLYWILGSGGPLGANSPPTPAPSPAPGLLPAPAPISSPPPFVVPSPSPSPPPGAAPQGRMYQVQAGDTLNRIAQNHGVTVDAIMQANGRTDRNQILRIGERLVIPEPPAGGTAPR
jgi:hypothetical protein